MPRLGVIGTMVWDRIYARDGRATPVEEWGGISYALAALAAAMPEGWEIVPILKVGRDLEEQALRFLRTLPGVNLELGIRIVPEPNNRVELHYHDGERRTECLSGGVPPWVWPELRPMLAEVDALYINFISGFEMGLEAASYVRAGFDGPIYADLHSLMLGVGPGGVRVPRRLVAWREWLRCFDILQLNEDELRWLAGVWGDPWRFAAEIVGAELRLLLTTLGPRGAAYFASPAFRPDPLSWYEAGLARPRLLGVPGAVRSEHIEPEEGPLEGDPTGCGDVWGATCFARLLACDALDVAIRKANRAAGKNVQHRGATGLHLFLRGRIET